MKRWWSIGTLMVTAAAVSVWVFWQPGEQEPLAEVMKEEALRERAEWKGQGQFWTVRLANPDKGRIDIRDIVSAREQVMQKRQQARQRLRNSTTTWQNIGPINQGGRTRAIWINPANPNEIIIGAVSGGLWRSTNGGQSWSPWGQGLDNLNISSIAYDANSGRLYVGTGEYFAVLGMDLNSGAFTTNTGFAGFGIYYSDDGGQTFQHLSSTAPTGFGDAWAFVNDVAVTSSGRVLAATWQGLKYSDDQGATWNDVTTFSGSRVYDIEVMDNDYVLVATNTGVYISTDGANSFTQVTDIDARGRIALASSGQYVYAVVADPSGPGGSLGGPLYAVYRSTNYGQDGSWEVIGDGTKSDGTPNPDFEPFCYLDGTSPVHCQSMYDMAIGVSPHDPNIVFVGGIFLFKWTPQTGWKEVGGFASEGRIHVDQHAIAFHPTNPDIVYVVNDGGVWISTDQGESFYEINKGYITTQYYAFSVHPRTGYLLGGTQDNGSLYQPYIPASPGYAYHVMGGDGNYSGFALTRNAAVASVNGGCVFKGKLSQLTAGGGFTPINWGDALDSDGDGCIDNGQFVHPFALWEDYSATTPDSVYIPRYYLNNVPSGAIILASYDYDLDNTDGVDSNAYLVLEAVPTAGPRVLFATTVNNRTYFTNTALEPVLGTEWFSVAVGIPYVMDMAFTPDGNCLFVAGTTNYSNGKVVRICGLRTAKLGNIYNCTFQPLATCPADDNNCLDNYSCGFSPAQAGITVTTVLTTSRPIAGIGMDPTDSRRVVVVGGGYGGGAPRVWYSTNALDATPAFNDITGDLPDVPVYDAIVVPWHPDSIILGTDQGIFVTGNATSGANWTADPNFPPVATFMLAAIPHPVQGGEYAYFAATHGRGYWTLNFDPRMVMNAQQPVVATLRLWPNPATDYVQVMLPPVQGPVRGAIYTLDGQEVARWQWDAVESGGQRRVDVRELQAGTYVLLITGADGQQWMSKFVIAR